MEDTTARRAGLFMRRRIRRSLVVLAALGVAVGVFLLLAKIYLASSAGGARVAAKLERLYGAPVQVGGVDVGLGHISLDHVRLYEAGANAEPWAIVNEVRTDLSPGELLNGESTPEHITLIGATIVLRFDRRGTLLTRLPEGGGGPTDLGGLQDIAIENSRVILKQEGRPDFIVGGVNATLRHEGDRLVATGTVTADHWGEWSLNGSLVPATGDASLVLRRPEIHFTQTMLDELPLIPPNTWQEVHAEGDSPVELTIRYDPAAGRSHYRVDLQPQRTRLRVTAIDLDADQVKGEIVIADGHVQLRHVTGQSADGTIQTDGDLDFQSTPEQLKFAVDVQGLRLTKLPRSWSLPPLVDGKLTGHADLVVTLTQAKARTNGEGNGIVRDVRFGRAPAQVPGKPIRLKLVAKGRGFQFAPAGPEKKETSKPPAKEPRSEAEKEEPDYLAIDLAATDADLATLLRGWQVSLPVPVAGRVSWQAQVTIPLTTATEPKSYRVTGNARLPWARIEDLDLEDVQTRIDYRNGILRLEEVTAAAPGPIPPGGGPPERGQIVGNVRAALVPSRNLNVQLAATDLSLQRLLSVLPELAGQATGTVSGRVDFRAPVARLADVTTWNLVGTLASPSATVFGWEVSRGRGNFHVEEGVLNGADLAAEVEGIPLTGSGHLRLTAPFAYEAKVVIDDTDPAASRRLAQKFEAPIAVAGPFHLTGSIQGKLRPLTIAAAGTVVAPTLEVEGVPLNDLNCHWQTDGRLLEVTDLRSGFFGGAATGEAVVPLVAAQSGHAVLRFQKVDAKPLARRFAAIPANLEGRLTGSLKAKIPAAPPGKPRPVTARLNVRSARLRFQQIPASRISGWATYDPSGIEYEVAGLVLDGRLSANGHVSPDGKPSEGQFLLEGARLSRLWEALGIQEMLGSLQGLAELEMRFGHDRTPSGTGLLLLRNLTWNDNEMAGAIRGSLSLSGDELRLRELSGDLGEGVLRGHAAYRLNRNGRGWFNLALEHVEAARLLAPWPAVGSRLTGPLDVQVRGQLGMDWHGNGEVHLNRGTLFGVDVVNTRLPFEFEFAPGEGNGQIACREAVAQVAHGRLSGRGSYRWGGDAQLDAHVRFFGVQVQALLHSLGAETGTVGTGQLSGRLDLTGSNVRSAEDLNGNVAVTLQQTQAQELPVVRQLLPFLAPGQSGALFTSGDLEARLARGVIRIQRFRLIGSVLQMVIEGTATLAGLLDLDVTANTSSPLQAGGASVLSARVPAIGAIPIRLLAEATSLFAGRLMHLRVTGTWRNPHVQVAPLVTLTEEAVRFFLGLATRGASIIRSPGAF